jgi:hypothetical protein
MKTIKGHRYEYLQRTWREGRHVRTESRYIGPAAPEEGGSTPGRPVTASDFDGVVTLPQTFYHGSHGSHAGLKASSCRARRAPSGLAST